MGITDAELRALADYQSSESFSVLEKLILDLSVAMCATPTQVSEELRSALGDHLSQAQLTEIVATIAWENHRARLNRALGVRAAGFSDGAYCVVPDRRP